LIYIIYQSQSIHNR